MVARDIESCVRCPIPVLPGDEVYLEKGEYLHREHVHATSTSQTREPIYL